MGEQAKTGIHIGQKWPTCSGRWRELYLEIRPHHGLGTKGNPASLATGMDKLCEPGIGKKERSREN